MKLFLYLTLPLYILDQLTKILILKNFAAPNPYTDHVNVIPGFFDLVRVHNTGIAFGKFNTGGTANVIFTCITITALIFITILWKKDAFPTKTSRVAVAFLIAGILGNLTDRLWHGYVVDFLDFYIGNKHWPAFNVADSCICIAAGLLFITAFQKTPEEKAKEEEASAS